MTIKSVQESIEAYLDRAQGFNSLDVVYATIADLCREKAEHVRTNWQDEGLADTNWQDEGLADLWERYGKACDKASEAFDKAAKRID